MVYPTRLKFVMKTDVQVKLIVSGQVGQEVEGALDPAEEGIRYMCDVI